MSYQVVDNGSNLWIANNDRIRLLMKKAIVDIRIVRQNTLKLTAADPLQSVYLPFSEVTFPQYQTPDALRDAINSMIGSCVCRSSGSSQPVP